MWVNQVHGQLWSGLSRDMTAKQDSSTALYTPFSLTHAHKAEFIMDAVDLLMNSRVLMVNHILENGCFPLLVHWSHSSDLQSWRQR